MIIACAFSKVQASFLVIFSSVLTYISSDDLQGRRAGKQGG